MQISPANFLLVSQQPIKQAKTAVASSARDDGFAPLTFKPGAAKTAADPAGGHAAAFGGGTRLGTKIDITV